MKLYILRHGKTEWNRLGKVQGCVDIPLAEEGISLDVYKRQELGLDDVVFEYEITSNRVDCYGVLGIAREAAATLSLIHICAS